jgi:hypothetical protein
MRESRVSYHLHIQTRQQLSLQGIMGEDGNALTDKAGGEIPAPRPPMYVESPTDEYLQGDVYRDVRIFVAKPPTPRSRANGEITIDHVTTESLVTVALVSHSCDNDPTHAGDSPNLDVQIAILHAMGSSDRRELVDRHGMSDAVNDPLNGYRLEEFIYAAKTGVLDDPQRIFLTQICTIPRSRLDRSKRVLQLTPEYRAMLKGKLALRFARHERGVPDVPTKVLTMPLEPHQLPNVPPPGRSPPATPTRMPDVVA